jgi:DNA-binding NarL/FixJ family response regulator
MARTTDRVLEQRLGVSGGGAASLSPRISSGIHAAERAQRSTGDTHPRARGPGHRGEPENDVVTVVAARFDPVVGRGLADILREDRRLRILERDLDCAALERSVAQQAPRVAVLSEVAERSIRARLRSIQPSTGILVFVHDPTPAYGMRLLAAEATCVAWSVSGADILAAVHLAARGERMFMSVDGHRVERRYPSEADSLNRRETQVLEHLSRRESNAEIALALEIGIETVRTYVASVLRKLNVPSRQELIGIPISPRQEDEA